MAVYDFPFVIKNSGGCPATPACGSVAAADAREGDSRPETIDDCWNKCSANFEEGCPEWYDCYNGCVMGLREAGLIE